MRLFAALSVPDEVVEELDAWWQAAAVHLNLAHWRDVPTRHWHMTLAFYGDFDGRDVDDLSEALGFCASRHAPFMLQTAGCGGFPKASRARVFWAGVISPEDPRQLVRLARCCNHAGHANLRKRTGKDTPFRGHITLARSSVPQALDGQRLAGLPDVPELSWQAETVELYQSRLHPDGARYRLLETFELRGETHVR